MDLHHANALLADLAICNSSDILMYVGLSAATSLQTCLCDI